jgi:hypothetical protein
MYRELATGFLGAFVWEYIARKKDSDIKPSTPLTYTYQLSESLFKKIGMCVAYISSFYDLIDLKDAKDTLHDLCNPIVKLCVSPLHFFAGYWEIATQYSNYIMIFLGSLTIVVLNYYGYYNHAYLLRTIKSKLYGI